jgi:regulatory protein
MIKPEVYKFHLAATLRFLGIRNRSRSEINLYLNNRIKNENKEELILQIIEYLDKHSFLDDHAFIHDWVEAKVRKGQGPLKIKQSLLQRGLDKSAIDAVLKQVDPSIWIEAAGYHLNRHETKWSGLPKHLKHAKAHALLSMKGFLAQHARAAIDRWGSERVE